MPNYNSPRYHLGKLLAHHENAAAAVRQTLALLDQLQGHRGPKGNGLLPGMLSQALQLDAARVRQKPGPKVKAKRAAPGSHTKAIRERRARTARTLEHFDATDPKPAPVGAKGIGTLLRRGYLKRKGEGYIRTGKAFAVTKS